MNTVHTALMLLKLLTVWYHLCVWYHTAHGAEPRIEIHVDGTTESRLLLRAITADLPALDEDTRAIGHYQHELRRIIQVRQSLDMFIQIGQHKTHLPQLAFDSPYITVLSIKREIDVWNIGRRTFEVPNAELIGDARFAGMIDLGDEGQAVHHPQPWEDGFALTAFAAPTWSK